LAYRFWQERGCPTGSPEVDWLRAEKELLAPALRHPDSPLLAIAKSIGAIVGVVVRLLFRAHNQKHEPGVPR
jgi:hypothetical protein